MPPAFRYNYSALSKLPSRSPWRPSTIRTALSGASSYPSQITYSNGLNPSNARSTVNSFRPPTFVEPITPSYASERFSYGWSDGTSQGSQVAKGGGGGGNKTTWDDWRKSVAGQRYSHAKSSGYSSNAPSGQESIVPPSGVSFITPQSGISQYGGTGSDVNSTIPPANRSTIPFSTDQSTTPSTTPGSSIPPPVLSANSTIPPTTTGSAVSRFTIPSSHTFNTSKTSNNTPPRPNLRDVSQFSDQTSDPSSSTADTQPPSTSNMRRDDRWTEQSRSELRSSLSSLIPTMSRSTNKDMSETKRSMMDFQNEVFTDDIQAECTDLFSELFSSIKSDKRFQDLDSIQNDYSETLSKVWKADEKYFGGSMKATFTSLNGSSMRSKVGQTDSTAASSSGSAVYLAVIAAQNKQRYGGIDRDTRLRQLRGQ